MGGSGRGRRASAGASATVFALSTIALLAAVAAVATLIMPVFAGTRIAEVAGLSAQEALPPSLPRIASSLAALLAMLYVFARATRNATMEVERVRTGLLRHAWMLLFEGAWAVGFAFAGEGMAVHAGLLAESLSLPSAASVAGLATSVATEASWVVMLAATAIRCRLARHDHAGRHVACEALRAVGRSTVVTLVWLAATVPLVASGWAMLACGEVLVAGVLLVVAAPCLAEGHEGGRHGHGRGRSRRN